MRPMASGHGASSSPPPPPPTCVVPLNAQFLFLFFLWRVSKEGVPSHGTNLGFTSADLLEGFSRGACPFHGTCLYFTTLNWLMWFDSLPLLGPGGLAFFFFFFSGEREISKHQVSRRTPYPFNAATNSNRRECAHCCWGDDFGSLCGPLFA